MTSGAAAAEKIGVERYLHEHIPISAAMGVRVLAASPSAVRLGAPLQPNINHRRTVFGGSAAAVAILAGWTLLHVRLRGQTQGSRIVIQSSSIDFRQPIDGDFEAIAAVPTDIEWDRFLRSVQRRGRGRIEVTVGLELGGQDVGALKGSYVVVPISAAESEY